MRAGVASRLRRAAVATAMVVLALALNAVVAVAPAIAAAGALDPAFGAGGTVVESSVPGLFSAVAVERDGRIVVAGEGWTHSQIDFQVARYSPAGRLDPTFGAGGRVLSDFGLHEQASAVAIQADGRILVAGTQRHDYQGSTDQNGVLARYTAGGVLDPSFGTGGWMVLPVSTASFRPAAIAVQWDGRILVAGTGQSSGAFGLVLQLNPDGSADPSFANGRPGFDLPQVTIRVPMYVHAMAVLPGGRIVVAGGASDGQFERGGAVSVALTPGGQPDLAYGDAGVARGPLGAGGRAAAATVGPDGSVAVAGFADWQAIQPQFVVDRLSATGRPDPTFGSNGEIQYVPGSTRMAWPSAVTAAPDGSIYVAGAASAASGNAQTFDHLFVSRIGAGGSPDLRFGTGGTAALGIGDPSNTYPYGLALQRDGSPVLTGQTRDPAPGGAAGFTLRLLPPPRPALGWGWNGLGQVGDATTASRNVAVGVAGRTNAVAVAAGTFHSLALDPDGSVWAWGWNGFGQLGDGTTTDRSTPVRVPGLTDVVAIAAGAHHSLAVKGDGSVWAWGWNAYGQLGDGSTTDRHSAVRVQGLDGVTAVKVAGGLVHSLLLAADGTVLAWGWNGVGQLGDATTTDRLAPVAVPGLAGVATVAAGAYHSLAVLGDGTVRSWGWNAFGQLGDGTTTDRSRPGPVPGLAGVTALAAGAWLHSVALLADGTARSWGWNGYGELGDGTVIERHSPVAVASPARLTAVAAGPYDSFAIGAGGTAWSWGWNSLNQLGDGTAVDRRAPVPVAMAAGTPVAGVAGGVYHSIAG